MADFNTLYEQLKASAQSAAKSANTLVTMMTADENTDVGIDGFGLKPSFSKQLKTWTQPLIDQMSAFLDQSDATFDQFLVTSVARVTQFLQNSGYQVIGDYTDGPYTLGNYNSVVKYDGSLYKLKSDTGVPFTTTGTTASSWANDSSHFYAIDGDMLSQQLASDLPGNGSSLIGDEVDGTVKDALVRSRLNTREIWRRSLAEAGLTLVDGSFEEGATVNSKTDAVWYIAGGQCYTWDGALPKDVLVKSTPATSGGTGGGAWLSVAGVVLRSQISNTDAATISPELQIARWKDDVDARAWGAKCDGVTPDSASVQLAIDYCLTFDPPARLVIPGVCLLDAPVNIDRMVDAPNASTFFTIRGEGRGCGFLVTGGINMFTTTLPGYNTSQKVNFENITFRASAPNYPAYVLDDAKFLRMRFTTCDFHRIKLCAATKYLQTYYFQGCTAYGWLGTFIDGVNGGYDIKIDGFIAEAGDSFVSIICNDGDGAHPVAQVTIINSLIQSMRKLALQFDRCQGVVIDNTYFEGNGADGSPDIRFATTRNLANFTPNGAIKVSGCLVSQLPENYNNPSYYSIEWGRVRNGFATANYLVQPGVARIDRLHKVIVESRLVVIGDDGFVQGHFSESLYSAGGYLQPGANGEALKILRGTVNSAGVIMSGSGFTVKKVSSGQYDIIAKTAFGSICTPTASCRDETGASITALATALDKSTVRITLRNNVNAQTDSSFNFQLIGSA